MRSRKNKRIGYIWIPLLFILGSLVLFILMKAGHMKIPQCRIHRFLLARVSPVQKELAWYYQQNGRFPGAEEVAVNEPAVAWTDDARLQVELGGLFPELSQVRFWFEPRIEATHVYWVCRLDVPPRFKPKKVFPKNIRNGLAWEPDNGPTMWDTFGLFLVIPIWGLITAVLSLWETLQAT